MKPVWMLPAGGLLALWWTCAVLIGWQGAFPINDDWSYASTVQRWLQTGQFVPGGWTSMTLWTHAAWGLLFCRVGGFSFETLRLAEISLGGLGAVGAYTLATTVGARPALAALAALCLAFNPLYLDLSYSFMTDVSFVVWLTWGAVFVARYARQPRASDWWAAIAFGLAATMCRQLGLSLMVGLGVATLLRAPRLASASAWVRAALPLLIGVSALVAFNQWLADTGRTPALYHLKEQEMRALLDEPKAMVMALGRNTVVTVTYIGLFLAPLAFARAWAWRPARDGEPTLACGDARYEAGGRPAKAFAGLMTLGALALMIGGARLMPVWGNGMGSHGLGPVVLYDVVTLGENSVPKMPLGWRLGLTALTLAGTLLLSWWLATCIGRDLAAWMPARWRVMRTATAASMASPAKDTVPRAQRLALLAIALAQMLPLLAMPDFFDRYVIVLIPLLAAALLAGPSRDATAGTHPTDAPARHGDGAASPASAAMPAQGLLSTSTAWLAMAWLAMAFLAAVAVAGTHDHLAWNRARWSALAALERQHPDASPRTVDGGFEYNALHLYDPGYLSRPNKSWWWVQDDVYLITFSQLTGTETVGRYPYHRWLAGSDGTVYALKRQ